MSRSFALLCAAFLITTTLLFAAVASIATAQDPEILPGMAGDSLPAGELPLLTPPFAGGRTPAFDADGNLLDPADTDPAATDSPKTGSADADAPKPRDFGVTGDWFGTRTQLRDNGISFKTNATQFYQGVASGGVNDTFRYGLKLDYFGVIEGEKLLGWDGFYINLHGETRVGQSVNTDVGALLPTDFALYFPQPTGTATALTNLQFQQYLNDEFVVTLGKINTPDGVNIHPFMGGYGTDRFMSMAYVINPMLGRILPYSTPGAAITYLRDLDPIYTFMVVDPMGLPGTSGVPNMFSNGVSVYSQLRIPVRPFDLPGHQTLEVAYSNGTFTSLSPDPYVIYPVGPATAPPQHGSWAVNYGFDQLLVVDPNNDRRGWGVFGNIGMSDGDPNPIRWFLNAGVAGMSPLRSRPYDSFGAAYHYLGTSRALRNAFSLGDEQGCELYYDAAVTKWFRLTADIQVINLAQPAADTALVLGLRGKLIF